MTNIPEPDKETLKEMGAGVNAHFVKRIAAAMDGQPDDTTVADVLTEAQLEQLFDSACRDFLQEHGFPVNEHMISMCNRAADLDRKEQLY